MVDLLAVDVALLLPEEVRVRAEAVNRALWLAHPDTLHLDDTHLPHLTLVQQFVRYDNLAALAVRIETVLRGRSPLSLTVSGIGSSEDTVMFLVDVTPALRELHEDLMEACASLEELDGDETAFYGPEEPARPRDVAWVRHYRTQAAYERYVPHITLGHGVPPASVEGFAFTADRVALCHLGRFCTCRVVLRDWRLPLHD